MNKFGIKIDIRTLAVLDLRFFEIDEFPKEYLEISEYEYFSFVKTRTPWSKYKNATLVNIPEDEAIYLLEKNKIDLRFQLENLHNQIGLAGRMREDSKDLLAEFERVKVLYNNLF